MLLTPLPRYRIEDLQTTSECALARPFAETELGYEDMEQAQKKVVDAMRLNNIESTTRGAGG